MNKDWNIIVEKLNHWKKKFGSHFIIEIEWNSSMACFINTNDILIPAADTFLICEGFFDSRKESFYQFIDRQLDKIYVWYFKYHILIDSFMIYWDEFTLIDLKNAMDRDRNKLC